MVFVLTYYCTSAGRGRLNYSLQISKTDNKTARHKMGGFLGRLRALKNLVA
jgi:hypothetical protein